MRITFALLLLLLLISAGFVISSASKGPDVRLFQFAKRQAERGNLKAQYDLALLYANGKGTATNETEAMKWIRKAAAQGEPRSQALLGASYANGGKGSPQDDLEVEKLFRKSAEQGWAEGQHNLACCYMDGRGNQAG